MARIEGVVDDIVFRNEQNGFTVLSLKVGRERVSAVGVAPFAVEGERLALEGEWQEHPEYGMQIRIASCESLRPTSKSGVERYLGSGAIRGMGPATAKMLVQRFGVKTLDVLEEEPDRILEIEGIGKKRAQMILDSYREQRETRQAMVFLQGYGIAPSLANRIVKEFGDKTQAVVRGDPYMLAERVQGVGFKTADDIAYALGVEKTAPHRLRCGVHYVLDEAANGAGHSFLPREALCQHAQNLLQVDEEMVEIAIQEMVLSRQVVQCEIEGDAVIYLPRLYEAECEVAKRVVDLTKSVDELDEQDAAQVIAQYEQKNGVELCREQREAVRAAAVGAVTIITGGPGTGKTTSINCIIRLMEKHGDVELCAPTGRAAKRMAEATGREARTIHRLLEYGGEEETFQVNEENPLEADAVIVDEMSMVDIFLMRALLRALQPGTRLVLVGDADQLPSVGAGNVLRDMIDSGALPIVRLTEIFRQAGESMIVQNAHRINHGQYPIVNASGKDFFLERRNTAREVRESVVALTERRLPDFMGFDRLRDIQVMTPMKKGEIGVWQFNRTLQDALNPKEAGKAEFPRGETTFRVGDKVMQTKNDYELAWTKNGKDGQGVFNGDIGFIEAIDAEEHTLTVLFDDDRRAEYNDQSLESLELAYCMSVHKSQGSEFEAVILPLLSGPPRLFTRNLLYTAVTRARKLVVLVGREECARQMVDNNHIARRYSDLARRLHALASL